MLEALVEIILQVLLQIVVDIAAELGWGAAGESLRSKTRTSAFISYAGAVLLGGLLGFVFTLIFPDRLTGPPPIKGLSLVVSPLLAGMSMHLFGQWRRSRGKDTTRLATFWGGALFALAFAVIRLLMLEGVIG